MPTPPNLHVDNPRDAGGMDSLLFAPESVCWFVNLLGCPDLRDSLTKRKLIDLKFGTLV